VRTVRARKTQDGSIVRLLRYCGGESQPLHAHDETTLSIVLAGSVLESVGEARVHAGPLQWVVKPMGTRHENSFSRDGTLMLQIVLSGEAVERACQSGCALQRWRWEDGPGCLRVWTRLFRCLQERRSDARTSTAVCEVVASVGPAVPRPRNAPRWLLHARERLREAPHLAHVATDAGVHRVHLAREFRRHFGITPTDYRLRNRVARAAVLLSASRGSLSTVAHEAGYSDQAHMTREFRRWLNVTPLEYRRLTGTG
jgi:AraC family transcriptional regulator